MALAVTAGERVVDADGVVVVVIPKGLHGLGVLGVVGSALLLGEALEQLTLSQVWLRYRGGRGYRGQSYRGGRGYGERSLRRGGSGRSGINSHTWLLQASPRHGAAGLEAADNLAEAHIHRLQDLYDAMKMIGHTYGGMNGHLASVPILPRGNLFPAFQYGFSNIAIKHGGQVRIIVQVAEKGGVLYPTPHHKGDEVYAGTIVVMSWVMRSI